MDPMSTSLHEWDARAYQRLSDPQFAWGQRVLERFVVAPDAVVVDAGCGSGRLTALLAEKVPEGRVIAVDRSANMIEEARERLASLGDRVSFVCADLATFVAERPVDAVFSTATFHWIPDHDRLFASVRASLRPGGQLVAQCGGEGNLRAFDAHVERVSREAPFASWFDGFEPGWTFQGPAVTTERLRGAGFVDVACALQPEPTPLPDTETFRAFAATVVLRLHLARLPDDERRAAFVDAVVESVAKDGPLALDYVRLNICAHAPEA
jgi:trans-aconitate 2-methyltransferase